MVFPLFRCGSVRRVQNYPQTKRQAAEELKVFKDWFRRKEIDSFAQALATELGRRFPPRSEERSDKAAANQLTSITSGVYARAVEYRRERSLGIYGKAKLGNAFRWKLKELGYSDKFIDEVTHGLVLRISKSR